MSNERKQSTEAAVREMYVALDSAATDMALWLLIMPPAIRKPVVIAILGAVGIYATRRVAA